MFDKVIPIYVRSIDVNSLLGSRAFTLVSRLRSTPVNR
jgi:hypothetical protein